MGITEPMELFLKPKSVAVIGAPRRTGRGSFNVAENLLELGFKRGIYPVNPNVDSILGATIQSAYKCSICGRRTEKMLHCGTKARLIKGIRWIDNNVTNLIATFFGAVTALALCSLNIF